MYSNYSNDVGLIFLCAPTSPISTQNDFAAVFIYACGVREMPSLSDTFSRLSVTTKTRPHCSRRVFSFFFWRKKNKIHKTNGYIRLMGFFVQEEITQMGLKTIPLHSSGGVGAERSFNYSNMVRNLATFTRPAYAQRRNVHCKTSSRSLRNIRFNEHNCEKCETNKSWQSEKEQYPYLYGLGCAPASLSLAQILMRETLNVIGFPIFCFWVGACDLC